MNTRLMPRAARPGPHPPGPGPAEPDHRWPVADCEQAVSFYVRALAAAELDRGYCACGRLVVATLALAGRRIELRHDPVAPIPEFGLLTLEAPDPEDLLLRVVAAGGTVEFAFPRRRLGGPGQTSILDPTGRRWTVRPVVPPPPAPRAGGQPGVVAVNQAVQPRISI